MVKTYLKEKNLEFEEIDVSSDQEKMQEMVAKSKHSSVPVIDIEGDIIVGFKPTLIKEALESMKMDDETKNAMSKNMLFDLMEQ